MRVRIAREELRRLRELTVAINRLSSGWNRGWFVRSITVTSRGARRSARGEPGADGHDTVTSRPLVPVCGDRHIDARLGGSSA
jgi:hypothetical protein